MKFDFIPIKTRIVSPPKDNIDDIFESIDLKDPSWKYKVTTFELLLMDG